MEAMKKKFLNMRSFREITWKSSIDLPMLKSFFSFFDLSGTVSFITCHVPFSCKNINLRLQRTYPCWYLLCILYVWIFSELLFIYHLASNMDYAYKNCCSVGSQVKTISCLFKLHLFPFSIVA